VPWRGPEVRGEFPTLGHLVADFIEDTCVVPDGDKIDEPFELTPEQFRHLQHAFRLHPDAPADAGTDAFVYGGSQLVRPQKWGKDPFMAARAVAHAFGPVIFAGWDARGEPVGRAHRSPWICCAATAIEQSEYTYRPIVYMLRNGPLSDTPGLDIGETRIKLPGIGWIEPVTASARARLGGRFTFVSITESHLLTGTGVTGGVTLARALKRNVAGMSGMWMEGTNAWDPTEHSAAQLTYEAKSPGVFLDYRPPRRRIPFDDDELLKREIAYVYGDSLRARGGWVSEQRIILDIRDAATGEAEARRFFLNEVTAGARTAVNPQRWDALARKDDPLRPGDLISLGFDGSRSRAMTALVACRIRDGRLFFLQSWAPREEQERKVPRPEVDAAVRNAFAAYDVTYLYADPYLWQDYLDNWAAAFPKRVVEVPTNSEVRIDRALERFLTAIRAEPEELTHDGDPTLTEHVKNAALAKGKRRAPREDEVAGQAEHYLKPVPKRDGLLIDCFVAAVLAFEARGQALEDGAVEGEYKLLDSVL
jgi:hypothetical protein